MTLKNQLMDDMKTAMKAKDSITLSTIRLVNAAIKQLEVDNRIEADDEQVIAIISKMIKQRKDSAAIYTQAERTDLAEKEQSEITVLKRYLPEMMSAEQIAAAVAEAIAETSATGMGEMGKVMGLLKTRLAGKADMGEINQAVKAALSA